MANENQEKQSCFGLKVIEGKVTLTNLKACISEECLIRRIIYESLNFIQA